MHILLLSTMLLLSAEPQVDEIVLFAAATTDAEAITSHSGGTFTLREGVLEVETKGGGGYPGVRVEGKWNLSGCNRLVLELTNHERRGEIPLTVRLDNADADPSKATGVFIDRVKISAASTERVEVALPPASPYAQPINSKLFGMRRSPLITAGLVADLAPDQVVAVAVYVNTPRLDWRWAVRRIVAKTGPVPDLPAWMKMPPEDFFPFIDVYGQFKHKDWPGKTHSDGDLKKAIETEKADLDAHPGPQGWNKYGGWATGPRRQATGRFRVEKIDGRWWMVDPEGCLYWSHGPVRVTPSSAVTPFGQQAGVALGPRRGSLLRQPLALGIAGIRPVSSSSRCVLPKTTPQDDATPAKSLMVLETAYASGVAGVAAVTRKEHFALCFARPIGLNAACPACPRRTAMPIVPIAPPRQAWPHNRARGKTLSRRQGLCYGLLHCNP